MLAGSLPSAALEERAPRFDPSAATATQFDDVDIIQAAWEVPTGARESVLPPALHPTIPVLLTLTATVGPDGGLGLLRLSCRHGARARTFLVDAVAWGTGTDVGPNIGCSPRDALLHVTADRLTLAGDGIDVAVRLDHARALGADDVQYVTGLHPVVLADRGLRLLQVEVHATTGPATGHRPVIERFTWPGLPGGVEPVHPVAATVAHGSLELPRPRFVARPDVLAHLGSERL